MARVKITWDVVGSPDTYSVYRSETQIDPNILPEPIATGITDKMYIDSSIDDGKIYHYRVASVKGSQSKISEQLTVGTMQLWFNTSECMQISAQNSELFHNFTATVDMVNSDIAGDAKWLGGVLAANGKIYCVPYSSDEVLIIDTNNGSYQLESFGLTFGAGLKYAGGCLAADGKIYCAPHDANDGVLVIDPMTNTASIETYGGVLSNVPVKAKYRGCVLGNDNKVYCIPYDANFALIIDVDNKTAVTDSFGITFSGAKKWGGGVLAANGKIYCTPYESYILLVIDTNTSTAKQISVGYIMSKSDFSNGVLGADGKIYCAPRDSNYVLVINPEDDSVKSYYLSQFGGGNYPQGATPFYGGGCLAADGKIYFSPLNAEMVAVIDTKKPMSESISYIGIDELSILESHKYSSMVMSTDGRIHCVPYNAKDILRIKMGDGVSISDGRLFRSPHYNKL